MLFFNTYDHISYIYNYYLADEYTKTIILH